MAGSSRTGLLITMILAHSGQVLELWPVPLTTQWLQQHPLSSRCRCIGYTSGGGAGWLWWCFDNKSPISINIFCHSSQMDYCWAWMMFAFVFCNWMFSSFSVHSSKVTFDCDIFLSFGIFGCHCIVVLFCMIIVVSKQLFCSIKFFWRRWYKIKKFLIIHD